MRLLLAVGFVAAPALLVIWLSRVSVVPAEFALLAMALGIVTVSLVLVSRSLRTIQPRSVGGERAGKGMTADVPGIRVRVTGNAIAPERDPLEVDPVWTTRRALQGVVEEARGLRAVAGRYGVDLEFFSGIAAESRQAAQEGRLGDATLLLRLGNEQLRSALHERFRVRTAQRFPRHGSP